MRTLNALAPFEVSRGAVERVGNLLLFVPLGLLAALLDRHRHPVVLVLGLAVLSLSVELAQLLLLQGRHPGVRDLVLNTVGAAAGVGLGRLLLRLRRRPG